MEHNRLPLPTTPKPIIVHCRATDLTDVIGQRSYDSRPCKACHQLILSAHPHCKQVLEQDKYMDLDKVCAIIAESLDSCPRCLVLVAAAKSRTGDPAWEYLVQFAFKTDPILFDPHDTSAIYHLWLHSPWTEITVQRWPRFSVRPSSPLSKDFDRLRFFTERGTATPFTELPIIGLTSSNSSERSLVNCREWMAQCTCHSGKLAPLPKRLIDVRFDPPRLIETNGELGLYACLSHCWGGSKPGCLTTESTFERNLGGIPDLPPTFWDAIDFTRRLNIAFIWIDSVCIIQDNETDWAEQSGLMCDIYRNSYLTLCATSSAHDNAGCYSTATSGSVTRLSTPIELIFPTPDGASQTRTVYVCAENSLCATHWQDTFWTPNMDMNRHARHKRKDFSPIFPLLSRAWAFQERLLSPRLVHFTCGELRWECTEWSSCECEFTSTAKPLMRCIFQLAISGITTKTSPGTLNLITLWHLIVGQYVTLTLTKETDVLPALSGVARIFQGRRPGDEYLAGLWRESLIPDLAWAVSKPGKHGTFARRVSDARIPTWSWASLRTSSLLQFHHVEEEYYQQAEAVLVSTTLASSDPTGAIESATLTLKALVLARRVQIWAQKYCIKPISGFDGVPVEWSPDCTNFSEMDLDILDGEPVLLLQLFDYTRVLEGGDNQEHFQFYLVLRRSRIPTYLDTEVYERIGALDTLDTLHPYDRSHYQHLGHCRTDEVRSVTII
ncbi:heterokaryon incompatibility protein-domain-containing protein [Podospora didyma]|uniref:Heterokaryon incompatibility protein-domain-containing protein n=1 Tax=Podospora didyma TaxID=330526 RepID=A0AAE0NS68_9PEZI|nr:heterokaryon incompatibility protein-domain-containing protein [Podospora didyma]